LDRFLAFLGAAGTARTGRMKEQGSSSRLSRIILPWPTILGIVVSFLACCLAGRLTQDRNCYRDFQRFHGYLSFTTLHYPTVSKVRAAARARLERNRIAVVVGGNSVLLGGCCNLDDVWTARLQDLLGDEYRVVNLAMLGARPSEFGATAAEVLLLDYPRLIFITNTWPCPAVPLSASPDGRPVFRYFFWEAYWKGWLQHYPARENALRLLERETRDKAFPELKAQLQLDEILRFRDLWTALEFNQGSTVWCQGLGPRWMQPRKCYPDRSDTAPPPALATLDKGSTKEVARLRDEVTYHNRTLQMPPSAATDGRIVAGPGALEQSVNDCFPSVIQKRMVMLVCDTNPYYVNQLTPLERVDYYAQSAKTVEALQRMGVAALEVGKDYPVEAYFDNVHLVREGERRMAEAVAPHVRELARRLGYVTSHAGDQRLASHPK
jgi:hypothetical protein